MSRSSKAVAFSVAEQDIPRLERLVSDYGHGNRSEFLRVAMEKVEASERAERLRRLQAYGGKKAAERGLSLDDVQAVVHRVRQKKSRPVA